MPMALSHYGDSSDYRDWSGLPRLHPIALGNTHPHETDRKPLIELYWDIILIAALEAMRGDGVRPEEN